MFQSNPKFESYITTHIIYSNVELTLTHRQKQTNKANKNKWVWLRDHMNSNYKLQVLDASFFPLIFLYQQKQSLWAMDDASCVVHGELNKTAGVEH